VARDAAALMRTVGGRPAAIDPGSARAHLPRLTARQREVAELVAAGASNREIAEQLSLSVRTVEGHVAAIRAVLGVRSRAGVAAAAATGRPAEAVALTTREREIAGLVASGRANHEIAASLGLSVKTVERQLSGCYRKLGVSGRSGLAAWVVANDGVADPLLPSMES
jgi:DNA-binding NarL/FixJ family response regulator